MNDLAAIRNALRVAEDAHGKQRYGSHPYKTHLLEVLSVGFEFGVTDDAILVAAPLHDTIEDTDMTGVTVRNTFGDRVARLVVAVSDPPGFKDRKARKAAAYPNIAGEPGAVTLKLMDRIANVRSCWREATADKKAKSMLGMYKKEYGEFRKALRLRPSSSGIVRPPYGPESAMWAELDRLLAWNP